MKLREKIIEQRLRKEIFKLENQFGFMLKRTTMVAIYLLRRLIKRYRESKRNWHMVYRKTL